MTPIKLFVLKFTAMLILVANPHMARAQWDDFFEALGNGQNANIEFGAALSNLYLAGSQTPLFGINLNYGFREDNPSSILKNKIKKSIFLIQASYYFEKESQVSDSFQATTGNPLLVNSIQVPYQLNQNIAYLMFNIREDYHFYPSKKELFSFYGGWLVGINFPFYEGHFIIEPYDETNYVLTTPENFEVNVRYRSPSLIYGINLGAERALNNFGNLFIEASSVMSLNKNTATNSALIINNPFFLRLSLGYRHKL